MGDMKTGKNGGVDCFAAKGAVRNDGGGAGGSKSRGIGGGASGGVGGGAINGTRKITHAALIAAIYAALTIWLAPISFARQQVRVAEALCVLPAFMPAAVPGLFVGCLVANIVSVFGLPDIIFGSLATLISAALTRRIARLVSERGVVFQALLIPLPAVVVNTLIIGAMLSVLTGVAFAAAALGVLAGQALSCYGLGAPLYLALRGYARQKNKLH